MGDIIAPTLCSLPLLSSKLQAAHTFTKELIPLFHHETNKQDESTALTEEGRRRVSCVHHNTKRKTSIHLICKLAEGNAIGTKVHHDFMLTLPLHYCGHIL